MHVSARLTAHPRLLGAAALGALALVGLVLGADNASATLHWSDERLKRDIRPL